MRYDRGVEVLFRPGSSLPEFGSCEKRESKKEFFFSFLLFFPSFHSFVRSKRQNDIFDQKKGLLIKKKKVRKNVIFCHF